MADILKGDTPHQSFAPLSHGQTVAICKHLEEQINQLKRSVQHLNDEFGSRGGGLSEVREELNNTNKVVRDLQEGQSHQANLIEGSKKDLGRTNSNLKKLQGAVEQNMEDNASLREAQKVTITNLQAVSTSLANTTATAHAIREDIEKRIGFKFEKLQEQCSRTESNLEQLREYDELDKIAAQEQKEAIRAADVKNQQLRDDLTKTNTVCQMLEQRVQDTTAAFKKVTKTFDESHNMLVKLHEDHDNTKSHFETVQANERKLLGRTKLLHDNLDSTIQQVRSMQSQVEAARDELAGARQKLADQGAAVQGLKEGHEMMHNTVRHMTGKLDEASAIASATSKGLRETNSFVLPNLHLDQNSALGMKAMVDSLSADVRKMTPRISRQSTQLNTARGDFAKRASGLPDQIGTVKQQSMDRSNWI